MQSKATTVAQYLKELPADRRQAIQTVRQVILDNLDDEYEEGMQYGMIGYYVPHRIYPAGYHCDPKQPLPFAALASQKNYMSCYCLGLYITPQEEADFRKRWAATGKKIDLGKCCIRFKKVEDLALELLGEWIRRMPARLFIERYESSLKDSRKKGQSEGKGGTKKVGKTAKKASPKRR